MPSVNDISIRLKVDGKEVDQSIGQFKRHLTDIDKTSKKSGQSLGDMFNKMKVGYLAAAAALAGVMKAINSTIQAASNLEEVNNKFNVVFDGVEERANEMAENLVENYMMSERAAKQYLSSVQDLLVPMGMAKDAAAEMSGEVVQLSADLGSFNNMPTEDVMRDIQSALVGNFETMKKYGVILNETVIKQEAMNQGVWNGKGMIDANTKAQIAFQIMTRNSSAAIGDVARSSDSYANTQKALAAKFEDLQASIGQIFMPVANELLSWIIDVLDIGIKFVNWIVELDRKWRGAALSLNEYRKQLAGLNEQELQRELNILKQEEIELEEQRAKQIEREAEAMETTIGYYNAGTGYIQTLDILGSKIDKNWEKQLVLNEELEKQKINIDDIGDRTEENSNKSSKAIQEYLNKQRQAAIDSLEQFLEYKRSMEEFHDVQLPEFNNAEIEMAETALEMKYEMGLLEFSEYSNFLSMKLQVAEAVYGKDHTNYLTWLKKKQKADEDYFKGQRTLKSQDLKQTTTNLMIIMDASRGKSKKMFEISKKASIAMAIVDTIEGATKAFNSMAEIPVVGVALGLVAAAAALAAGYTRVSQIRSTTFNPGYSSGGYTGAGGKHEPAGIVHRGEVVFSQDDIRRFGGVSNVESLRRSYADGGVVGGIMRGTQAPDRIEQLDNTIQNMKLKTTIDAQEMAIIVENGNKTLNDIDW